MSTSFRLLLPRQIYNDIVAQAQAELPNECCGLLAGRIENDVGRVQERYPLINVAATPERYLSDGGDLPAAFRSMRERSFDLLAIYHSHPTSRPVPSQTDLAQNFYGNSVVFLILSLQTSEPEMRAWRLGEGDYRPAEWSVVDA